MFQTREQNIKKRDDNRLYIASQQVRLLKEALIEAENNPVSHTSLSSWRQGLVSVHENPPPFLSLLGESSELVIIVSAEKNVRPVHVVIESSSQKNEIKLEVTGNPLEAPYTAEDLELIKNPILFLSNEASPHTEHFEPLSNDQVRAVQHVYVRKLVDLKTVQPIPVTFVCDGTDGKKVVLLQCQASPRHRIFATREEHCDEAKRGILRLQARDKAIKHAMARAPSLKGETQCVRYEEHCTPLNPDKHNFVLRTVWKQQGPNLDCQPPLNAGCHLEMPLIDDYDVWEIGALAEEMRLLRDLVDCLQAPNQSELPLNPVPGGEGTDLLNKTRKIVLGARAGDLMVQHSADVTQAENKEQSLSDTLMRLVAEINAHSRPNMDFTDSVWNNFKYCQSISEVSFGMKAIFKELLTTDAHVLPNNPTFLAEVAVRVEKRHDPKELPMQPCPAGLLLEAGYNKLCRDIVYICQAGGLCTAEDAKTMIRFTQQLAGQWDDRQKWQDRVEHLQHVLLALELLLRTARPFTLNLEAMRSLLTQAIATKLGGLVRMNLHSQVFTSFFSANPPYLQRWTFKATNSKNSSFATATFACSKIFPFLPWATPLKPADIPVDMDSTMTMPEGNPPPAYFCATLHKIVSN
ncbi:hypothetical protein B566_EDAN004375 [Ephemera danica]|nr:hypothetical protein B566_EDAN004375 [Ephemera danica]